MKTDSGLRLRPFKRGTTLISKAAIYLCALLSQSTLVAADDTAFRLTGFGTIGVTHAGNDELGYHRSYTQEGQFGGWKLSTDSAIGLQLNADFNASLDAVVQVIGKNQLDNSFERSVEWAFLRYKVTPNIDFRAGRMAIDLYSLSEYRQVGFAYLWARPITEFYTPIPVSRLDGVDLQFSHRLGRGILQSKLFAGRTKEIVNSPVKAFEFTLSPIYGLNLNYQIGAWKARMTLATGKIEDLDNPLSSVTSILQTVPATVWPEIDSVISEFEANDKRVAYYSAGFTYDWGDWIAQSEFAFVDSDYVPAPSNMGSYFSIGNRVTDDITAYVNYAKIKTSADKAQLPPPLSFDIPGLAELYSATNIALNHSRLDQHAVSLGMRWNLNPNLALKVQWDHISVADNGSGLWASSSLTSNEKQELDTFSISLDFIF